MFWILYIHIYVEWLQVMTHTQVGVNLKVVNVVYAGL